MRKIDVVHNQEGWGDYDDCAFETCKSIVIKFIEDLIKDGIFPQIRTSLCPKMPNGEDCYVLHIKNIWFYEDEICFVLDDDYDSIVNN